MRRALPAALLAAVALAAAAAPAEAQITVRCFAPEVTACSGQWHRAAVQLRWTLEPPFAAVAGCRDETFTADTAGEPRGCTARAPSGDEATRTVTIRRDATPPLSSGGAPARPPDANGWYRSPVAVAFAGSDATSGLEGCSSVTYAGPDSGSARVAGTCRDRAGNTSAPVPFPLRFDATPPAIAALQPARRPDHGAWYTRPVTFAPTAADATSGLAGCDPLLLSGPESPAAPLAARCRDHAGNATTRSFGVPYDASAPRLGLVRVQPGDRRVRLDWSETGAETVRVSRSPGRAGAERTVLSHAHATELVDRRLRNGRRYVYRVTATDAAGNRARRAFAVRPGPRLLAPAPGARVSAPVALRWTPVAGARYYNVQLFRGARKVLSAWPTRAEFALPAEWRHAGRTHRLEPGRYRWIVWPGRGAKAENRYGPVIGARRFVAASP